MSPQRENHPKSVSRMAVELLELNECYFVTHVLNEKLFERSQALADVHYSDANDDFVTADNAAIAQILKIVMIFLL